MRNTCLIILISSAILHEIVEMHMFSKMDPILNEIDDFTVFFKIRLKAEDILSTDDSCDDRSRENMKMINDKMDVLFNAITESQLADKTTAEVIKSTDWPTNRLFITKNKKRDSSKTLNESPKRENRNEMPSTRLSGKINLIQEWSTEKVPLKSKPALPFLKAYEKGEDDIATHLESKEGSQVVSKNSSQTLLQIRTTFEDLAKNEFAKAINNIYRTAVLTVNTILGNADTEFLDNVMKLLRILVANIYTMFMETLPYIPIGEKAIDEDDSAGRIQQWLVDSIMEVRKPADFHDVKKRLVKSPSKIVKGILRRNPKFITNRRTRPDRFNGNFMWGNLAYSWWDPRGLLPGSITNWIPESLNPMNIIQNQITKYINNMFGRIREIGQNAWNWMLDTWDDFRDWLRVQKRLIMEYAESFSRNVLSRLPIIGPLKKSFQRSRLGQYILWRYFHVTTTTTTTTEQGPGPFQRNTILKSLRMVCDPEYKGKIPRHPFHPAMGTTIGGFFYDLLYKDDIFVELPTTKRTRATTTTPTTTTRRKKRKTTTVSSRFIFGK